MDAQKEKLKKYAEFQDMETIEEYSYERHSGKNIKGLQEFMQMLNNSEDGKDGFDFGLVVKLCDAEETERRFNHAKKMDYQNRQGNMQSEHLHTQSKTTGKKLCVREACEAWRQGFIIRRLGKA